MLDATDATKLGEGHAAMSALVEGRVLRRGDGPPELAQEIDTRRCAMSATTSPSVRDIVHSDPEMVSGTPVFVGTRVPVHNLFDYLAEGDSLDIFLQQFPAVSREQAVGVLEVAREVVMELTRAAPAR